jgi:lysyl-tRNA synthetase class 2
MDDNLLRLLPDMPDCAGIALGFDRLAMLAAGVDDISGVKWDAVHICRL